MDYRESLEKLRNSVESIDPNGGSYEVFTELRLQFLTLIGLLLDKDALETGGKEVADHMSRINAGPVGRFDSSRPNLANTPKE